MRAWVFGVALVLVGSLARADIALLANGRTFKIDSHRMEGELVFLVLRDGGEVGTPRARLKGIVSDEIVEEVVHELEAAEPGDLRALTVAAARRHGLDPELVLAVVSVESAFQPDAVSPKGARGLMQLMPATAQELGVDNAFDPAQNLEGGSRHLRELVERYDGDLRKALAAYNAGVGAVHRYGGVPPYPETRDYVKKVLDRYQEPDR